ncbi:MAG: trypsin-like peptidase domain-containing protein [Alphaproteobacteria bacterium]|nr:trypsin-like peptidase domain-containing protein [Alphaproteobacteria bacterium]MBU0797269.1 trypsin-like peptidase domain-containing protein [Alphaproteobacteria bacterium]MBU0888943.1 trypsin-like peptidase domain-containing protein [Alphaproteobacteria bacterium]MBU1813963.1 trypsin-like peptidase domain-containing protein [Alphaproteobacteria bacterium]MBU2090648.1 trypsin-like peptidase domain-containing protein [Alphaproteobacteria bacterium]
MKHFPIACLVLCLGLLALSPGATAQDLPRSRLVIGADDRKMVSDMPAAIGRLNISGFARRTQCTAVLVAPDIVATAAHCVTDRRSGDAVTATRVHFLAGLTPEGHKAYGQGRCIRRAAHADVALVILAKPVKKIAPLAFLPEEPVEGMAVAHAGYALDRPYALTAHRHCRVLRKGDGMLHTDCDTNHGQSGGPVLVERDGKAYLAGIMVGAEPGEYSAAVGLSAVAELLGAPGCRR